MCGGLSGGRGRTEGHRARWRTGVIPGSLGGEVISQESSGVQTGHSVVRVSSAHVWPSASFPAVAAECHRPEGLSGWRRWDPSLPQPRERDGVTRRKGREELRPGRGAGGGAGDGERRPGFALSSVARLTFILEGVFSFEEAIQPLVFREAVPEGGILDTRS